MKKEAAGRHKRIGGEGKSLKSEMRDNSRPADSAKNLEIPADPAKNLEIEWALMSLFLTGSDKKKSHRRPSGGVKP